MPTRSPCYAIVLAAGRSTRFGSSKLLETIDSSSIVERAVTLASKVCGQRTLLVVGHDRKRVLAAAGPNTNAHIVNEQYADGLSTSIVAGVHALEHCAEAVLILLADQVKISEQHLHNLLEAFDGETAVATEYASALGPPVVFSKTHFAALKNLRGDAGAKQLLMSGEFDVLSQPFEAAAIDIDTPEDLARFR